MFAAALTALNCTERTLPKNEISLDAATSGESRPTAPAGTRIYAIGDSHGCSLLLHKLHELILEDCGQSGTAPGRKVVVYLGDYVDRGPDSRGLLEALIARPLPGFESVYLMGNHDVMLLRLVEEGASPDSWVRNGALETLESYGIDPVVWQQGPQVLRAAVMAHLPAAHLAFLRGLKYSHVEGDYFFAHAGVRPGVPLDAQDPEDLLWIRGVFLDSQADHGKVVVHGHTPVAAPQVRPNRIGIDTGAVYGGELTALVLEGTGQRFLQVA